MSLGLATLRLLGWPSAMLKGLVIAALACGLSQGYSSAVHAFSENQASILRNSPEVLALHYQPTSFGYKPIDNRPEEKECQGVGAGAPVEAPGSTGLIPFLLGALFAEETNRRREQLRVACATRAKDRHLELEVEGKRITEKLSLRDPTRRIKERVLAALAGAANLRNVRSIDEPQTYGGLRLAEIKEKFGISPVIEFQPLDWGIEQRQSEIWEVLVQQDVAVFEVGDYRQLTIQPCRVRLSMNGTYAQLVASEGALLKEKILEAADRCAGQLIESFTVELKS